MNCSLVGRPASLNSRSPSERFWLTTLLGIGSVRVVAAFGFFRAFVWGRAIAAERTLRVFLFAMFPPPVTQVHNSAYSTCLGREVKGKHCEAIYCEIMRRQKRLTAPPREAVPPAVGDNALRWQNMQLGLGILDCDDGGALRAALGEVCLCCRSFLCS